MYDTYMYDANVDIALLIENSWIQENDCLLLDARKELQKK